MDNDDLDLGVGKYGCAQTLFSDRYTNSYVPLAACAYQLSPVLVLFHSTPVVAFLMKFSENPSQDILHCI